MSYFWRDCGGKECHFQKTMKLRMRGFSSEVKCRRALWFKSREALWSNCKRAQSSEPRCFPCKKNELLLRSLRSKTFGRQRRIWQMLPLLWYLRNNAFPYGITSSKHAESWENASRIGKPHSCTSRFPNATRVFSQFSKCLDKVVLHGNKLYIAFIK